MGLSHLSNLETKILLVLTQAAKNSVNLTKIELVFKLAISILTQDFTKLLFSTDLFGVISIVMVRALKSTQRKHMISKGVKLCQEPP